MCKSLSKAWSITDTEVPPLFIQDESLPFIISQSYSLLEGLGVCQVQKGFCTRIEYWKVRQRPIRPIAYILSAYRGKQDYIGSILQIVLPFLENETKSIIRMICWHLYLSSITLHRIYLAFSKLLLLKYLWSSTSCRRAAKSTFQIVYQEGLFSRGMLSRAFLTCEAIYTACGSPCVQSTPLLQQTQLMSLIVCLQVYLFKNSRDNMILELNNAGKNIIISEKLKIVKKLNFTLLKRIFRIYFNYNLHLALYPRMVL